MGLLARLAHAVDRNESARGLTRRLVPEDTRRRVAARIGADRPQEIDLSMVELIRERDPEWLADPENLEHELLPALGLCNDPRVYPPDFGPYVGRGLKHWQSPNQFSRYLAHLARYPIRSYLELGVWHGGTFVITVEYLSRFNALESATAMDRYESDGAQRFAELRPEVEFLQIDTTTPEFAGEIERRGPFDLALVDADHSYEACTSDVLAVREHANMIALHDMVDATCGGVVRTWQEMKERGTADWEFFEFAEQYDEVVENFGAPVLGLGVAVRKDFEPAR
jgi:Methyltransferase domain